MITHHTVLDLDAQARRCADLNAVPAAHMPGEEAASPEGRLRRCVKLISRRLRGGAQRAPAGTEAAPQERGLTARELDVLRLIAGGRSTREIAASLAISEGTVERHITNLYAKIRVRSRSEATAYAFTHQLVAVPKPGS